MEKSGHHDPINEDYYINISANSNTLKSVLILEKDYQVDFNNQNSIVKVLGLTNAKYTEGFQYSQYKQYTRSYRYNFGKLRQWNDEKHHILFFFESQPRM